MKPAPPGSRGSRAPASATSRSAGSASPAASDAGSRPRPWPATSTVTRTFFRDCQEWGWCARRFDPKTALATPRSVRAMLGPKPRVIADDAWAKILWAGLNLSVDDLAAAGIRAYPLELVRALALTWLFAAQRSDEIVRLRVGCIRWQHGRWRYRHRSRSACSISPSTRRAAAFTKPVDPVLGRAIEAWESGAPGAAAHDRPQDRRGGRPAVRLPRESR